MISFALRFISGDVAMLYTECLRNAEKCGFSSRPVSSYLSSLLVSECRAVALELALYEANIAVTEGVISSPCNECVWGGAAKLWDDPDYIKYINSKYVLLEDRLNWRLSLVIEGVRTLVQRLFKDLKELRVVGRIPSTSTLQSVTGSLGDSHNGGKRAAIVGFSCGKKVMYKPRPVCGEAAFQRVIILWNTRVCVPPLAKLWVVDKKKYGWMEFVESTELTSIRSLRDYYERVGVLSALCYMVSGTDLHFENVIPTSYGPVAVDLETIVQPYEYAEGASAERRVTMMLNYFVNTPLYTGLVAPSFLDRTIGGSPLTSVSYEMNAEDLKSADDGTLEIVAKGEMVQGDHLPSYHGQGVPVTSYVDDFLRGYEVAETSLALKRSGLLNGELIKIFEDCEVRVILRATVTYLGYISAFFSPYAMQCTENSIEVLSTLWRLGNFSISAARAIPSEIMDICNGDVPYFSAMANDVGVWDSAHNVLTPIFKNSGLDIVLDRVAGMSASKIRREVELLRYCLLQGSYGIYERHLNDSSPSTKTKKRTTRGYQYVAKLIYSRIIVDGKHLLFMEPSGGYDLELNNENLATGLYNGFAGVLLALAYCSKMNPSLGISRAKLKKIADLVIFGVDERSADCGLCLGSAGVIYLCSHLAVLWEDTSYTEIGEHLAKKLGQIVYRDRFFDIFSGAAGMILAVDSLAAVSKKREITDLLSVFAEHLVRYATVSNGRANWLSSIPSNGPTSGFAHGVSGIAYALLRANARVPTLRVDTIIRMAERYLDDCFNCIYNTWSECRADSGKPRDFEAWCHGAPGIALLYEELCTCLPSAQYQSRYATAIRQVIHKYKLENDSLCHGTLGNIDPLISGCGDKNVGVKPGVLTAILAKVRVDLAHRDFICGTEYNHESISLFTGLSGFVYQSLRMENPNLIPSLLKFSPPRV